MAADTKTTILDAAEHLFAEHGYAATSLRQLTAAARVNLAAVHYHFGSKEELVVQVLSRRLGPINAERRARLDALRRAPTVEAIVRAFVEPPLRAAADERLGPRRSFCRLFGRVMVEQPPFLRAFLAAQFRDLATRFEAALRQAGAAPDAATRWWRLHFLVGAMAHTLQNSRALAHLTDGLCRDDDIDAVVDQLVDFAVGGFAARRRPRARPKVRRRRKAGAAR
jgi:AcrR family transcriptional regulator